MELVPGNVLAEGEATGHAHRAMGEGVVVEEVEGSRVLHAPRGAVIVHEEHGKQELPAGDYDRLIVQEYDHAREEAREVID